ncbi:uncharacterized protein LOC135143387 [Zophobas morio]|uniref:uncharacterized protein LOC135143387 n=1 Tax=Zophobas morio TaxID=2755281 RepID=UPI003083985B
MKYFLSTVLFLVAQYSFSSGSQIVSPALTPVISRNVFTLGDGLAAPVAPAPGLAYGFPPALIQNYAPAVAPLISRGAFPVAPAVAAAPLQPLPGAILPTGYTVPSPALPVPFAPQARSIHALAPATFPGVAPALPPLTLAR